MAGNMAQMGGGPGQMMRGQGPPRNNNVLHQFVYQQILQNQSQYDPMSWQATAPIESRVNNTINLISQAILSSSAGSNGDQTMHRRCAEFGVQFERSTFTQSQSKDAYESAMKGKATEILQKRQSNGPRLQNAVDNQISQNQQAQAMMNMQAQLGRGQMPQQGFPQQMQGMNALQLQQQQQQQQQQRLQQLQQQRMSQQNGQQGQPQQQQAGQQVGLGLNMGGNPGMGMNMNMGMANQAGRGIGPGQQQQQQPRPFNVHVVNELRSLGQTDREKVQELAGRMMGSATSDSLNNTRLMLRTKLPEQTINQLESTGDDILSLWFRAQALGALKSQVNQVNRNPLAQGGPQNQNGAQAAIMQQQQSQQAFQRQLQQQRQNMMGNMQQNGPNNAGSTGNNAGGSDFPQFGNIGSIQDQQMDGLRAQHAGQQVVPVSNGGPRNSTPQPANQQNLANGQRGFSQGQRPQTQQGQNGQQTQQSSNPQGMTMQQMQMNQAAQQSQAQLQAQAQLRQIQGQQGNMAGMPPSQSPGMGTLNTPVSRPPSGMNQGLGIGQGNFGDQRFPQGGQIPNNATLQAMMSQMSPEQRNAMAGKSQDKLNEVMARWQAQRQDVMMNNKNGQAQLQQNQGQNQLGQMNQGLGGQGMPQPGAVNNLNQGQMQMPQGDVRGAMDAMDLPPNIIQQLSLPQEVTKWRNLKAWMDQNGNQSRIPPTMRQQLAHAQQRQFAITMRQRIPPGGQMPMANGMSGQPQNPTQMLLQQQQQSQGQGQPPQQQQQQQQQRPRVSQQAQPGMLAQQMLKISPEELNTIRQNRPQFAHFDDNQLRTILTHMRMRNAQLQQQSMRAQQQPGIGLPMQNQSQGPGFNQQPMMAQPQPNMQPQAQAPSAPMAQSASMQGAPPKQTAAQQKQKAGGAKPSPAQPAKNLKRRSAEDLADTDNKSTGNQGRPASRTSNATTQQQQQQQQGGKSGGITAQGTNQPPAAAQTVVANPANNMLPQNPAGPELIARLKVLGQEEQTKSNQETMTEISMSPQELVETGQKLEKTRSDLEKIGKGLSKWFSIKRDEERARMFFRYRMRILRQFDKAGVLRPTFSVRSQELDEARAMLETMAKDLAAMYGRGMMKQHSQGQGMQAVPSGQASQAGQSQQQGGQGQQAAGQPSQPAPLSAANLEKNTQAHSKANQQKGGAKGAQASQASGATQAPFAFNAGSPHGNPSYIGKAKDMNLQLPPSRKKQKLVGQQGGTGSQAATPSPKIGKNASPNARRASENQPQNKPLFVCQDWECESLSTGFPTQEALQQHVTEEHTKPREDPVKFAQEHLALTLGLEADGSEKKGLKIADAAPAMSTTTSKQGQTPVNVMATPKIGDSNTMRRSVSEMSKMAAEAKAGKTMENGKGVDGLHNDVAGDIWGGTTIDPQSLLNNMGYDGTVRNFLSDFTNYRSETPKDTPESARDSGASEPTSDISEGANLEIGLDWSTLDTDMLLNLGNASIDGDSMNHNDWLNDDAVAEMLSDAQKPSLDWDEDTTDWTKPIFDDKMYSMYTE